MRKLLLNFVLIVSVPFIAQAGYVIRGISVNNPDVNNLMNYTLTIDGNDSPIAAGTMHAIVYGSGRNSIVIIDASNSIATYFPIPYYDIEVRDFHRVIGNEYVLCGSCNTGQTVNAFVAVIDGTFTTMDFYEYSEADMFYSICADIPTLDYYVCGTNGDKGVIASINRATLQITNMYETIPDWEYHKIIAKRNTDNTLHFVASGRTPDCTQIGCTVLDPSFNSKDSYLWAQQTELDSHCVVSNDLLVDKSIILASSYQNMVTLNLVSFSSSPSVSVYQFAFPNSTTYFVQDIETCIPIGGAVRPFLSVAGYTESTSSVPNSAWYGSIIRFPSVIAMTNNYYVGTTNDRCEHYKIRYDQNQKEYTGGYYQDGNSTCALFGSPLIPSDCNDYNTSLPPIIGDLNWRSFSLVPVGTGSLSLSILSHFPEVMNIDDECPDFKSAPAPEYAMPSPEDESDIIALQDRISLKDVPSNTNYQIYSVIGQLMQTGTTTPDISTAQLGKGVYILRLENGKTFKFVK